MITPEPISEDRPLELDSKYGMLRILIGANTLKMAAENHEKFWNGYSGMEHPNIKVTDAAAFLDEVLQQLLVEGEDGSTPVMRMFDDAIEAAVENGCEGVDHDYIQPGDEG